jgi:uncharacterized membrane protein YdbT with pleckstrin-like domain
MSTLPPNPAQENVVWSGTPSQMSNLALFALCAVVAIVLVACAIAIGGEMRMPLLALLLLPAGIALWRWLLTASMQYTLTDQRLKTRHGVFGRVTDDIELYRVKDSHFTQSFVQRLLGIGTITLRTTDDSSPHVVLNGMGNPEPLWEQIRALVEARRDAKGVREIDMNAEPGPH